MLRTPILDTSKRINTSIALGLYLRGRSPIKNQNTQKEIKETKHTYTISPI